MLYCQNCGAACEDTDTICKICGSLLAKPPESVQGGMRQLAGTQPLRPYTEHMGGSGSGTYANGTAGQYGQPRTVGGAEGGYGFTPPPGGYPPPAPYGYYYTYAPKSSNSFAVASMVLGIVGIVTLFCDFLGFVPAVLAIIFGFVSRSAIKKSNGAEAGSGMATAGIVLGFITVAAILLLAALFVIFMLAGLFSLNGISRYGFSSGQSLYAFRF